MSKYKNIHPPFIELNFYYGDKDDKTAYEHLEAILLKDKNVSIENLQLAHISDEASQTDNHPIVLFLDGSKLSVLRIKQDKKQIKLLWGQVYKQFRQLIETTHPSYGAITTEYELPSPTDLQKSQDTYPFIHHFFIHEKLLDPTKKKWFHDFYTDMDVEIWSNGIYVSQPLDSRQANWEKHALGGKKVIAMILDGLK